MNSITIRIITIDEPEYQQVWDLREEVLRKPLGMSLKNDDLSMDSEDVIFIAEQDGKVIGCLMLHHLDAATIKFRQMAVDSSFQGKNIGRKLMQAAEEYAKINGYSLITLHARKVVSGFYTTLGFTALGDEFTEVGIPHLLMNKTIA